jgi:hypothetical protein
MGLFKELFTPALKSEKWKRRRKAVMKLTDQSVLADIAKNDDDWHVRKAAYERLGNDQSALAEVAKNDEDLRGCYAIVEELTDPSVLADIAKNAKDSWIREAAVNKLTDQSALADVAKNAKDRDIRKAAVWKLTDPEVLADIAQNDSDISVRGEAEKELAQSPEEKRMARIHKETVNTCHQIAKNFRGKLIKQNDRAGRDGDLIRKTYLAEASIYCKQCGGKTDHEIEYVAIFWDNGKFNSYYDYGSSMVCKKCREKRRPYLPLPQDM